jgi:ABC-type methionine transport system ATPase subunit
MKRRVLITYPADLVQEPIIYKMVKQFDVAPNIRRADVTADVGWLIMELDGEEENIEAALQWATEIGVRVDHAMGEVLEG